MIYIYIYIHTYTHICINILGGADEAVAGRREGAAGHRAVVPAEARVLVSRPCGFRGRFCCPHKSAPRISGARLRFFLVHAQLTAYTSCTRRHSMITCISYSPLFEIDSLSVRFRPIPCACVFPQIVRKKSGAQHGAPEKRNKPWGPQESRAVRLHATESGGREKVPARPGSRRLT